jgi:hypothetical protein
MPCNVPAPGALRRLALLVLTISLTAVALVLASTADASQSSALQGIAWTPCGPQLECARVQVPLDWRHRSGRKIELAVIRHLASRPDQRIGSLFLNPGGPATPA